jgi:plastocyanin
MNAETLFQIAVGLVGSLATAVCALAYFRRVRLERPPIGIFNTRDLCVLGVFIVALPVLYVHLPPGVLTAFIVVTFLSALSIALRPLFASRALWVAIPLVLTADIVVTRSMDHMRGGLQLYWLLTSAVVLMAAVGVSNLYVQGGLELRQIAHFTLFLAVYDIFFTRVIALTPLLAVALQGRPLDPSVGFAAGAYNANVGLGDLLVFCLFTIAAYKGHGRRGALTALGVIAVFGAVAPSVTPLVAPGLFGTTAAAFVPIQALFGPAAFAAYRWLARSEARPAVPAPAATPRRARPTRARRAGLALPGLAVAGLIFATIAGSGDVAATSAAATPAPSGPAIAMRDVAFTPGTLHVKVGTTVTWTNDDRVPHDVVATAGARFGSTNLLEHATFRFRALRPGTIHYECTLHQGMRGTIVVSR